MVPYSGSSPRTELQHRVDNAERQRHLHEDFYRHHPPPQSCAHLNIGISFFASRIRFSAMAAYSGLSSQPMYLLWFCHATRAVVPAPMLDNAVAV